MKFNDKSRLFKIVTQFPMFLSLLNHNETIERPQTRSISVGT